LRTTSYVAENFLVMQAAVIFNLLIILFALIGLYFSYRKYSVQCFFFYTVLSNCIGLIAAVILLLNIEGYEVIRFMATVMLCFTFLVTAFVLVPLGGDFKELMFGNSGLFHHTLVPILSLVSYLFFEKHHNSPWIPVIFTMFYGLLIYYLNYIRVIEGTYPFFKIHKIGIPKSVMWFFTLLFSVYVLANLIIFVAGKCS